MQLLAIGLYNSGGELRRLDFAPDRLNIVTGESKSGKSALLDIVEYCLGRSSIQLAVGPITSTVAWYAAVFLLPSGGKVLLARPAPREGKASNSQAMMEFGDEIDLPEMGRLSVNVDTSSLREQLGRRIGIGENETEVSANSARSSYEASLGHAALLCLQGQDEVASKRYLFHRQGEDGIKQAIVDTLPYFLGALPRDQALQRTRLRDARRDLARTAADLTAARRSSDLVEVQLAALWAEASAVGLVQIEAPSDRARMVFELEVAANGSGDGQGIEGLGAGTDGDERRNGLDRRRREIRDRLKVISSERRMLLDTVAEADAFRGAVGAQAARLVPLGLVGRGGSGEETVCPVCDSRLEEPDPSVAELEAALLDLEGELRGVDAARPSQRSSIGALATEADALRDELRSLDLAAHALVERENVAAQSASLDVQSFARGRVSAVLGGLRRSDPDSVARLEELVRVATNRVDALEAEVDPDDVQRRLEASLLEISRYMTSLSRQLELEHTGEVWLDLRALTVVTQTSQGAMPLTRVGSGENWVGAHIATYLALHRYFVRWNRPVPRFVIFDQPTQAFYPSEVEKTAGVPSIDADRIAVERMFRMFADVVADLSPGFQIVVCDHANLADGWFQDAVVANWRDGEKLIPLDWIDPPSDQD